MISRENCWALVLAAGEGKRLRSLTTTSNGESVPKQFCSLNGGRSLLHEAIGRAHAVVHTNERICTIVAGEQRRWWERPLRELPKDNIVVQPSNRGTANGILFPLLHILERDPEARVIMLPSDHHVRNEAVLNRALEHALTRVERDAQNIVLLGIEPEEPDAELGYILPNADTSGCPSVKRFVEKPTQIEAHALMQKGALWNTFILVAQGSALLRLFEQRSPETVLQMRAVLRHPPGTVDYSLRACSVYATLPEIDFSRHICQGQEEALRVLPVPACGWSDLGTPQRVSAALRHLTEAAEPSVQHSAQAWTSHLNLATRASL